MWIAERTEKCTECNFCKAFVCPSTEVCIGCGACFLACPYQAIELKQEKRKLKVKIEVNGKTSYVPDLITVKQALELTDVTFSKYPSEGKLFAPCEVGGCWSCVVRINGEVKRSCVTPVKNGMKITTELPKDYTPLRIIHGPQGHTVGGVGTPYDLKGYRYIEVVNFTAGCNLRCPQCQNWQTTYCGKEMPLTPKEAALPITKLRKELGVNRLAVSGGEPTLNRRWLVNYFKELKKLNPEARIHLDTNATLLTKDYIDELVEAGMTDCGIDLKAKRVKTFQTITGVQDKALAKKLLATEWDAAKYLIENYSKTVFTGLGIPYNKDLISLEEVREIGHAIYELDPEVQVCILDYRPEFRRMDMVRPSYEEMRQVHAMLREAGLKRVIAQTWRGYLDPSGKLR